MILKSTMEELEYLCRLCASKMGILMGFPIFEVRNPTRSIDKKIAACLPVQVCYNILKLLHLFKIFKM